uniref:Aspartyl/glutamyl-tRNA(Asn/Gln) amidotransferase subunit B n=1 Tax=Lygus hesperus TaxID=30085 RepID=A0A0A9XMV6_LYGHE
MYHQWHTIKLAVDGNHSPLVRHRHQVTPSIWNSDGSPRRYVVEQKHGTMEEDWKHGGRGKAGGSTSSMEDFDRGSMIEDPCKDWVSSSSRMSLFLCVLLEDFQLLFL